MKTKRIEGKFYRQLEAHEVVLNGDKYLCRQCGALHRASENAMSPTPADRANGREKYYREVDPLIAQMLRAKEKHAGTV